MVNFPNWLGKEVMFFPFNSYSQGLLLNTVGRLCSTAPLHIQSNTLTPESFNLSLQDLLQFHRLSLDFASQDSETLDLIPIVVGRSYFHVI